MLDRAEAGQLTTPDGAREAIKAMLKDDRARDQVNRFHAMWLGFETIPFEPQLAQAMSAETGALLNRVVFEENRPWQDIFRLDQTFANDALAEHYGLPLPGSTTPVWVTYPSESRRRGLLSHGTFLSRGAKFGDTSPTQRGLVIRTRLFCQEIKPAPADVNVDMAPGDPNACKVDRYKVHAQGGCASCHSAMDPVGFGLEAFDLQGRIRATEPNRPDCPISGDGELSGVGTFNGPGGLGELAVQSGVLNRCVVGELYRFAIGRNALDEVDERLVDLVEKRLGGSTADFRFEELLTEVLSSEAFRYRRLAQ